MRLSAEQKTWVTCCRRQAGRERKRNWHGGEGEHTEDWEMNLTQDIINIIKTRVSKKTSKNKK